MEQSDNSLEAETRESLLKNVKREVKQIMEEAVTRKFIHEESSSVISLCGVVENCLQHGLKKRSLGLFKNSTTTALLQKVAKNYEPAARLLKILNDLEKGHDSTRRSVDSSSSSSSSSSSGHHYHHLLKKGSSKYLWIRIALYEKLLAKILDYLVQNSNKYFEREALMSDPVCGAILASLLVGPCALEFTQMKTVDHLWTDPPAKELMQRHRIHSTTGHNLPGTHADSPKRLALQVHKTCSSNSEDCQRNVPFLAKEYVESLHQNSRSTLLYGKNNVVIQPKEDVEAMAGYLSLHQNQQNLVVKWTPNQLMNVSSDNSNESTQSDRRPIYFKYSPSQKSLSLLSGMRSQFWNYALAINLDDIVYLHCHQQSESGGTVVLVGQDGVQRPPIHFPKGGHLWAFLSCIESGLMPTGYLEPPLSCREGDEGDEMFPTLLRKKIGGASNVLSSLIGSMTDELNLAFNQSQSSTQNSTPPKLNSPKQSKGLAKQPQAFTKGSSSDLLQNGGGEVDVKNDDAASDYVFRIIKHSSASANVAPDMIPEQDEERLKDDEEDSISPSSVAGHRTAVRQLCSTMSSQILSRAFYGWLSHCRQLKTVRTHLSGLVHSIEDLPVGPVDVRRGLTIEGWKELMKDGRIKDEMLLHQLIYFGGCDADLRKEVWPFLLEHYKMESDEGERVVVDEQVRKNYEASVVEWSRIEEAIKFQEKDKAMTLNTNSLTADSNNPLVMPCNKKLGGDCGSLFVRKESSLSSDVFESVEVLEDTTATPVAMTTSTCSDAWTAEASSTVTTTSTSLSSSLSSLPSSSSSSSAMLHQKCQRPLHFSHHSHAKRMLDKSKTGGSKVKLMTSEEANSLDSSDSMKLNSVDLDMLATNSETGDSNICGSIGVPYSISLLENFALNIHRIDKDVHRCDRNHAYFSLQSNLRKLRNVMCTYVWNNMDMGYVQGMCDLAAPLLVVLDREPVVYSCFSQYMKRMSANFPNGNAMDQHFGNMRSLIQIMDPELFEHMKQYGDYTHFYFCYRWFLLDFKRELVYSDVFRVWETIWSSRKVCSPHFVLFIALALLEYYREVIIDNRMDFTEIIKFFNELAERHNANEVLNISRSLVERLQELIENK